MSKNSNRDLLKEAIADAQAVKETAIANAKAALSEAFTPHLKELFASKLEEMENEGKEDSTKDLDEEKISDKTLTETEENVDEDINSLLAELEDDETEEEETETEKDTKTEKDDESEINVSEMSEEELKSFVEDVIKDMVESGELDSEETEEVSDDEEINLDELLSEIEEVEEDSIQELTGLDVVGDISSAQAIGAIIGAIALVTGVAASEFAGEIKAAAKKGKDALQNKIKDLMSKANSVKENDLEEATATIESLRNDINEVKLLNAKLLYVNKIFKAKNLNNSQKVKVVESFDKAKSIKDAKLIYETLVESIKEKAPINESVKGLASKSTGISRKETIIEPNPAYDRMRKLAGLK